MRVFARARLSMVVAVVLGGIAMLLYPGGTVMDRTTEGYSFSENFLSDLGMTVAYDGQPNRAGAVLFVVSLLVLLLGLGGALLALLRQYSAAPAARRFAIVAGAIALVACLSFVGVAFTPENSAMSLHVWFTRFAFFMLPFAALFVVLAARASGRATAREVAIWEALCVALAAYAALLQWGPPFGNGPAVVTYVLAQKAITASMIVGMALQCSESGRPRTGSVPA